MNVNKNPFGGIVKLPSFGDIRQWFRGKFGYIPRDEGNPHEYFPVPRDPPFPSPTPQIILPRYFNRREFKQF